MNESIDIKELLDLFWKQKNVFFLCIGLCTVVGLSIALMTPNKYDSTVSFVVEGNSSGGGGLSGRLGSLAGLAGISLGGMDQSSAGAIHPFLYAEIVNGLNFNVNILNQKVSLGGKEQRIRECVNEYRTKGVIERVLGQELDITKDSLTIENLNKESLKLVKSLRNMLSISMDEETGLIKIKSSSLSPKLSKELAEIAFNELTQTINEHQLAKQIENKEFVFKQLMLSKSQYESDQMKLAEFRDENFNINSQKARTIDEKLQYALNVSLEVYTSLSREYEQSKIDVQDSKVKFTILNQATVPLEKSGPKRGMMLMFSAILGVMIAGMFLTGKYFIKG